MFVMVTEIRPSQDWEDATSRIVKSQIIINTDHILTIYPDKTNPKQSYVALTDGQDSTHIALSLAEWTALLASSRPFTSEFSSLDNTMEEINAADEAIERDRAAEARKLGKKRKPIATCRRKSRK